MHRPLRTYKAGGDAAEEDDEDDADEEENHLIMLGLMVDGGNVFFGRGGPWATCGSSSRRSFTCA